MARRPNYLYANRDNLGGIGAGLSNLGMALFGDPQQMMQQEQHRSQQESAELQRELVKLQIEKARTDQAAAAASDDAILKLFDNSAAVPSAAPSTSAPVANALPSGPSQVSVAPTGPISAADRFLENLRIRETGDQNIDNTAVLADGSQASNASGYYQFVPKTLAGVGGDPNRPAKDYTKEEQTGFAKTLTDENYGAMKQLLGREPNATDLYAAHHFGPGTAAKIAAADYDMPMAQVVGEAALKANPYLANLSVGEWLEQTGSDFGFETAWSGELPGEAPPDVQVAAAEPTVASDATVAPAAAEGDTTLAAPFIEEEELPPPTEEEAADVAAVEPAAGATDFDQLIESTLAAPFTEEAALPQDETDVADVEQPTPAAETTAEAPIQPNSYGIPTFEEVTKSFSPHEIDMIKRAPAGTKEKVFNDIYKDKEKQIIDYRKPVTKGNLQLNKETGEWEPIEGYVSPMQAGNKAYDQYLADRLKRGGEGADQAVELISILGQARSLAENYDKTGIGGEQRLMWEQLKGQLGLANDAPEGEALRAISTKLAGMSRIPGSGATSDMEMRLFLDAQPGLLRSKGGNLLIIDMASRLMEQRLKNFDSYMAYVNEKGTDIGWRPVEIPVLSDEERAKLTQMKGAGGDATTGETTGETAPATEFVTDPKTGKLVPKQ